VEIDSSIQRKIFAYKFLYASLMAAKMIPYIALCSNRNLIY